MRVIRSAMPERDGSGKPGRDPSAVFEVDVPGRIKKGIVDGEGTAWSSMPVAVR
jgi:hypothetical protein